MRHHIRETVRARSIPRERRERRRIRDECGVDRGHRSVISTPSRRLARALARRARAFERTCPISSSSSSSLESTRTASSSS
jgi:hypothetical protein